MYQFALRPRWILTHVLVGALLLGMVWAGLWQLSRMGERKDQNALIEARSLEQPVDVATVSSVNDPFDVGADLEFLRVFATGTFDRAGEVLVRNRPLDGAPGRWALTPLVLEDGSAILVNRGWLPNSYEPDAERAAVDPPAGTVTVHGFVRPTEVATGLQVALPESGVLTSVARPNIARLDQQLDYSLLPIFIQADRVEPASDARLPAPVALPPLDGGPHFSYAMQWFIFATIAAVGYPLILRRVASGKGRSLPTDEDLRD